MSKRKIAVIIVDRANYGRLKPVMTAIQEESSLEMQVVCGGSTVLERYGKAIDIIRDDGFPVHAEVYHELHGSNPITMAKCVGFSVIEFASEFQRLKPDLVLIIGDRYEALAAALAASYMNLCIAHIQGGEVSGSIDESARHCITKLAHYHFPSTRRSAEYLIRMGEKPDTVFGVGCPSGDIAHHLETRLPDSFFIERGVGGQINSQEPYLLVVFHPVTTHFGDESDETTHLLNALDYLKLPTVWLWPNIDAGSDNVSKRIRNYREHHDHAWLRLIKNFSPEDYLKVLANAACAVGNSSSFVRDASFLGTPVVLVGNRQNGREMAENVLPVEATQSDILVGLQSQLSHGRYPVSSLYGDGSAGKKIARLLTTIQPYRQKQLSYTLLDSDKFDSWPELALAGGQVADVSL
jgi:UDP-hydrolysing UDP-N-acetyl-D-glucosamine 2-epimerase